MGIRYDRERVEEILDEMIANAHKTGIYQTKDCLNNLEKLLGSVRSEAVSHTWIEACSQYDRGMDPRNITIPILVGKVIEELNPVRD
jgi:hypothetical protein